MILSSIIGLVGIDILAEELKDPAKKAFGWLFDKSKDKYDEHKLNQAFNNLSERITNITKVKTIYKGDDSIDLHEFYVPTRIEKIDTKINSISDINIHSIVLEGTVGQGKSIFMRFLTYQEAKQGQRIPLFFELRRLEDKQTLTNALSRQVSHWIDEFKETDFDTVAKSGSLVLFLDGFDEVPHNKVKTLLNEIEGWCERYPEMQVVISSRPEADIQRSNYFKVFKLFEYRFYEQSILIDKLVEETESNELLKQAIKDSNTEIQELLTTPLMVTLFVMNYRGNLEIPSNQYEFYKDLFSVLISRHDKTKPGYQRELNSDLSKKQLQEVFEQFCFISLNKDKLVFSYTEAIEIVEKCLYKQKLECDSDKVLTDFSKVVCLLLKDGMDYTFVHKSIPEYFYACYVNSKSESAKERIFSKMIDSFDFFKKTLNVKNFLRTMDLYSYLKFYELSIINRYIGSYSITETENTILEKTYFHENFHTLYFEIDNIYHLDAMPLGFEKFLSDFSDKLNMPIHASGIFNKVEDEELIRKLSPLKSFISLEEMSTLKKISIDFGNRLINRKHQIEFELLQSDEIELNF